MNNRRGGPSRNKPWTKVLIGASTGLLMLLTSGLAAAQDRTFTLDRAQLSGAPDDGFMVHRPYAGEETRFYGNAALGFSLNPLRDGHIQPGLQNEGSAPITGQFPVYLTAGLQLEGLIDVNLHIPFTPLQLTGTEPAPNTAGITDQYAAMNDIRFDARVVAWESKDRRTRLGVFGGFTLATGSQRGFGGDRAATALVGVNAEHLFGKLLLTGHLAPHFRPSRSLGSPDGLFVGNELRYAVGVFYPLRDDRVRLGVEVWGTTGIENLNGESTFFSGRHTTLEWLGQGRFALNDKKTTYLNAGAGTRLSNGYGSADVRALISIGHFFSLVDRTPDEPPARVDIVDRPEFYDTDSDGDGYPDTVDACPNAAEDGKDPKPNDGCPAPQDSDGDGIVDAKDKCPDQAEDFDSLADEDGCPEDDLDQDKVKDEVDRCPEEPGPPNADPEKNGCPTLTKVTADGMVSLLQPIEFERGKASIKPSSFPILQEVATLMEARENIKIQVQGHTDNIGSRDYNLRLSKERAASVLAHLVKLGIDDSRLSSEGFGPDKPVDTNQSAEGRSHNRRVDFVIVDDTSADEAWE